MSLHLTNHAIERMAQRGFRVSDLDLIVEIGSEVDDGYLVREKDCREIEVAAKRFLERIRRLRGKRVVIADGFVVTTFHAHKGEQRRLLRGSH